MENKKYNAPLDSVLEIDVLPFKMTRRMMVETAFWGQNQTSFKAAEQIIEKVYGLTLAADTVRRVTDYVGQIIYKEDSKYAQSIYAKREQIKFSFKKKGILYIQVDGASLNTRHKDENGSSWRENKLGVVFSSDNLRTYKNKKGVDEHSIEKREYTTLVGTVEDFEKYLFACAIRNGYGEYQKTILLSDGTAWIHNMAEKLFPDAIQIIDLYHLCENTYSVAKAIFKGEEALYRPWAEDIVKKIKNGEIEKIKEELQMLKKRKLPVGTVNLITYIENNMGEINYSEYKKQRYYVGSEAVESGNKNVLQKRLQLANMRWAEESAQYLLTLRSKFESGLWKNDVEDKIMTYKF